MDYYNILVSIDLIEELRENMTGNFVDFAIDFVSKERKDEMDEEPDKDQCKEKASKLEEEEDNWKNKDSYLFSILAECGRKELFYILKYYQKY